jgi:hypothetical protein
MRIGYLAVILGGMAAAGTAVGIVMSAELDDMVPERESAVRLPITRAERNAGEPPHGASESAAVRSHEDTLSARAPRVAIPRDPAEWQGMPVRYHAIPCSDEAVCQAALACIDGYCDSCSNSEDCQAGEVCVVEHCVLTKLAKCTSFRDCPSGEVCVLSGYSDDVRGNGAMEAMCSGSLRTSVSAARTPFFRRVCWVSRLET